MKWQKKSVFSIIPKLIRSWLWFFVLYILSHKVDKNVSTHGCVIKIMLIIIVSAAVRYIKFFRFVIVMLICQIIDIELVDRKTHGSFLVCSFFSCFKYVLDSKLQDRGAQSDELLYGPSKLKMRVKQSGGSNRVWYNELHKFCRIHNYFVSYPEVPIYTYYKMEKCVYYLLLA